MKDRDRQKKQQRHDINAIDQVQNENSDLDLDSQKSSPFSFKLNNTLNDYTFNPFSTVEQSQNQAIRSMKIGNHTLPNKENSSSEIDSFTLEGSDNGNWHNSFSINFNYVCKDQGERILQKLGKSGISSESSKCSQSKQDIFGNQNFSFQFPDSPWTFNQRIGQGNDFQDQQYIQQEAVVFQPKSIIQEVDEELEENSSNSITWNINSYKLGLNPSENIKKKTYLSKMDQNRLCNSPNTVISQKAQQSSEKQLSQRLSQSMIQDLFSKKQVKVSQIIPKLEDKYRYQSEKKNNLHFTEKPRKKMNFKRSKNSDWKRTNLQLTQSVVTLVDEDTKLNTAYSRSIFVDKKALQRDLLSSENDASCQKQSPRNESDQNQFIRKDDSQNSESSKNNQVLTLNSSITVLDKASEHTHFDLNSENEIFQQASTNVQQSLLKPRRKIQFGKKRKKALQSMRISPLKQKQKLLIHVKDQEGKDKNNIWRKKRQSKTKNLPQQISNSNQTAHSKQKLRVLKNMQKKKTLDQTIRSTEVNNNAFPQNELTSLNDAASKQKINDCQKSIFSGLLKSIQHSSSYFEIPEQKLETKQNKKNSIFLDKKQQKTKHFLKKKESLQDKSKIQEKANVFEIGTEQIKKIDANKDQISNQRKILFLLTQADKQQSIVKCAQDLENVNSQPKTNKSQIVERNILELQSDSQNKIRGPIQKIQKTLTKNNDKGQHNKELNEINQHFDLTQTSRISKNNQIGVHSRILDQIEVLLNLCKQRKDMVNRRRKNIQIAFSQVEQAELIFNQRFGDKRLKQLSHFQFSN